MSSIALLIPAAGRSERFGGAANKLLLPLGSSTVLQRTLAAFAGIEAIREWVLIYGPDTRAAVLAEAAGASVLQVKAVAGGPRRQDSVANGLAAVGPDCDTVMIHDAARPFVARATIEAAIAACETVGAASVGVPCSDTIKQVGAGDLVERTLDRTRLWRTQTPQVFRKELLAEALRYARRHAIETNDEAELVERMGRDVRMVPGSAHNIKITTPDDLILAQRIADRI